MKNPPKPKDFTSKNMANYISHVVRNEMEGFHVEHLSDQQMAELNPIIRNAIYGALELHRKSLDCKFAEHFVSRHMQSIPAYWEPPELSKAFNDLSAIIKQWRQSPKGGQAKQDGGSPNRVRGKPNGVRQAQRGQTRQAPRGSDVDFKPTLSGTSLTGHIFLEKHSTILIRQTIVQPTLAYISAQ